MISVNEENVTKHEGVTLPGREGKSAKEATYREANPAHHHHPTRIPSEYMGQVYSVTLLCG